MGKYLNGSAGTGKKILKNRDLFNFENTEKSEFSEESYLYRFKWDFDGQTGYISITVKEGKISNSSLIDTVSSSSHKFDRPLGLYNDPSLKQVFTEMMTSLKIDISGVY